VRAAPISINISEIDLFSCGSYLNWEKSNVDFRAWVRGCRQTKSRSRLTGLTCSNYSQNASSQIYTKNSTRLQFVFEAAASAQPEIQNL
jgi:hypothetical protein